MLCVLSELLRSDPALFRVFAQMHPFGRVAAAPEPVDSRWHFLIDCLRWLLSDADRRAKLCKAILQHYGAVERGKINEAKLSSDALFLLFHLQSNVSLAALSVALDLGCATTKAELSFLQLGNGLHMAQVHDFFQITCRRRLALFTAAQNMAADASSDIRSQAKRVVEAFSANTLSATDAFSPPSTAPAPSALAHLSVTPKPLSSAATAATPDRRRSTRSATVSAKLAEAAQAGVEDSEIDGFASREQSRGSASASTTASPAQDSISFSFPKWTRRTISTPDADDCNAEVLFPTVFREAKTVAESERQLFLAIAAHFAERFLRESAVRRPSVMKPYFSTAHYIAGMASPNTGQRTAWALVQLGSEGLLDLTARQTGLSVAEVLDSVKDPSYRGPLGLFCDKDLLRQLELLSQCEEQGALWTNSALASLHAQWKAWFAGVSVSADCPESVVKTLAGLRGQQRTDDEIASRFLRNKINPQHSVLAVHRPVVWDIADSMWQTLVPEHTPTRSSPLRLRNSENNPNDVAVPPLSAVLRTKYNQQLGYNKHYTEEEKAQREQPPKPATAAQLASTALLCRHHFAKRAHPPEPELTADGTAKKRRRKGKAKTSSSASGSASSSANGKDEKAGQ